MLGCLEDNCISQCSWTKILKRLGCWLLVASHVNPFVCCIVILGEVVSTFECSLSPCVVFFYLSLSLFVLCPPRHFAYWSVSYLFVLYFYGSHLLLMKYMHSTLLKKNKNSIHIQIKLIMHQNYLHGASAWKWSISDTWKWKYI